LFSGIKIIFKREFFNLESLTWQVLFYVFWLSTVLGFIVIKTPGSTPTLSMFCGGVGIAIAEFLNSIFGWFTPFVLAFILILFILYFYGPDGLDRVFSRIDDRASNLRVPQMPKFDFGKRPMGEADEIADEPEEQSQEPEKEPIIPISKDRKRPTFEINGQVFDEGEELPKLPSEEREDSIKINSGKKEFSLTIENPINEMPGESDEEMDEVLPEETFEMQEEVSSDDLIARFGIYDPRLDLPKYQFPTLDLLKDYQTDKAQVTNDELKANSDRIVETLNNYGIGITSIKATIGPTVTLYEIIPDAGVRISKIKNLEDDIALSLAALGIRIIAPIPGKGTIGIEVPNKNRETVAIKTLLASERFQKGAFDLPFVLGKTISNEIFMADLAKMPHLLMAGATGQGKSVGLNVILASLLYKKHPAELKFVLIDPKKVELTLFNKIERHYLAKLPNAEEAIITDTRKVVYTLNSLCIEMDARYDLLKEAGCRNIKEYNVKFINRRLDPNKGHKYMPYIVLVIDELADLMMTAGKEVEQPIARLAQLARAIGIHLVVATQRPSVNVITGIIKANFPARLSFKVTSKIDSRTILDTGGAEQLIGMGDMLLSQGSDIIRLQCAFVDTPEIEAICDFIGDQMGYDSAYELPEFEGDESGQDKDDVDLKNLDPMFPEAARVIVNAQQGSTSLIQRKLKLGYNRAGRLMDQLEATGIVGPFEGSKAREVLLSDITFLEEKLRELGF
jgi:DNA segregation ATPase FtsK/SpoIIIE, S-DNA-T family